MYRTGPDSLVVEEVSLIAVVEVEAEAVSHQEVEAAE